MPPTPTSTLLFAAAMGMLWLSVAPLVSGLVADMFGTRYMATLLGIAFVMHQVGSSHCQIAPAESFPEFAAGPDYLPQNPRMAPRGAG